LYRVGLVSFINDSRKLKKLGPDISYLELPEQYQDQLVHSLETALLSPSIPAEILQTLLNLAEFMVRTQMEAGIFDIN